MIIFKDILTDDEIISDVYDLKDAADAGGCLWEVDAAMVKPGQESFVLEGANASAEGEDADDGGDEGGDNAPVLNLARDFRYQKIEPPSDAKAFSGELKKYLKKVMDQLKAKGRTADIEAFKKGAPAALKKVTANFKNYDFYIGEGAEPTGDGDYMYVLVDFRDDGITPYATIWKHALTDMKV